MTYDEIRMIEDQINALEEERRRIEAGPWTPEEAMDWCAVCEQIFNLRQLIY